MTITPAAIIWPPSLIRASISNLSSRTPISQISAAPESSARGSLDSSKTSLRLVRWAATSRPAHSPKNMAMPPSRGVGSRCTSRARISGIAPAAMANFRTGPVSRYVTAAVTQSVSRYSRTGCPTGIAGHLSPTP